MNWNFETVHDAGAGPLGGLAWSGSLMLFADVAASAIRAFDPLSRSVHVWRNYSNRSNGIVFGPGGALFACQEGGRRVVRMLPDGSTVPTRSELDGRQQNHPRAIAVDAAGAAWFSDCHHATPASGPQIFPLQEHQSILRLSPAANGSWSLERMTFDTVAPRGVALSPDGQTLFVVEAELPGDAGELRAYRIAADGKLHEHAVLHRSLARMEGLCTDAQGHVLACVAAHPQAGGAHIAVFDPSGALLHRHALPQDAPVQCAFGDSTLDALYVTTAGGQLLRATAVGLRGHPAHVGPAGR